MPGTLVALATFAKHHRDFSGDLVVVHDGLCGTQREQLALACPGIRFEPVSTALRCRLDALASACPALAGRWGQFYSLEAFRLRGYRKVLFYDSDVLFQGSIADLFSSPAALLCCPDGVALRGGCRDAATFAPMPAAGAGPGVLAQPFGAGFMLIDAALVEGGCYAELLALVSPETWRGSATHHTDQFVLNRGLAGRQTLVSSRYDFALPQAEAIRAREGIDAAAARVLHFSGAIKPWMPDAMLRWTLGDPDTKPRSAFRLWYDAYVASLTAAHLRTAGGRFAGQRA